MCVPARVCLCECVCAQLSTAARKKAQKELFKRKNYEIRTLKEELCDKEQALYDREKRLMSLETSLVRLR